MYIFLQPVSTNAIERREPMDPPKAAPAQAPQANINKVSLSGSFKSSLNQATGLSQENKATVLQWHGDIAKQHAPSNAASVKIV